MQHCRLQIFERQRHYLINYYKPSPSYSTDGYWPQRRPDHHIVEKESAQDSFDGISLVYERKELRRKKNNNIEKLRTKNVLYFLRNVNRPLSI